MPTTIEVPLRWRDLDHQGHVYHATVLTLMDEARTVWLADALGISAPDEYVVARIAIDYRDEIRRDDGRIHVNFEVAGVGTTSLTLMETVHSPDGRLLVEAHITAVMWDRTSRRPRALLAEERDRAAELQTDATEVSRA